MFSGREKLAMGLLYLLVGMAIASLRLARRLEKAGPEDNGRLMLRTVFELLAWPVALVASAWK